jgi:hypothetical protein
MGDAAYISKIEDYLYQKLKVVSKNVYAGHLPSTLPSSKTTFVVIDCSGAIYDNDAYHSGVIAIYLYAAPSSNLKNVAKLYEMEKKYTEDFLANSDNENYSIVELTRKTDYDSSYGLDFIYSAINIIIKEENK